MLAEEINRLNKIVVLNLIRQEGEISRAEIVKRLNLSSPTVTRIVDSLINDEELAVPVGIGESKMGRPPLLVKFNSNAGRVIGIDWGRTHIRGVVANLNAEVECGIDVPVKMHSNFDSDMISLVQLIHTLISKASVSKEKILGIGLAVAGYFNHNSKMLEFSPNFGWKNVDIAGRLIDEFDIPITIDNVSRVMALGELLYGSMKNNKNFIFVNVGYGIGSGVILNGELFVGSDGFAGELGHNRISGKCQVQTQRICSCGKWDCLESYASGRGIAQSARERILQNKESLLYKEHKGDIDSIDAAQVAKAAEMGDTFSVGLLEEAATMLGVSMASISNIINPEAIVIGGRVANAGSFFIDKLRESFSQEILPNISRVPEIRLSDNIGSEAVKGVVALTLREVLNLNIKIPN